MIVFTALPDVKETLEKQQKFVCRFIDIKVNGFNQYCDSLNELTFNYWKPALEEMTISVKDIGEGMKYMVNWNPIMNSKK